MKPNTTNTENRNRVNNNITDFGAKIGGAFKDRFANFRESIEKLTTASADQLRAVGLSQLVKLPNLEKMTEAGMINAEQARAALIIWRQIERRPQNYGINTWAEKTREKLAQIAAALTAGTISDDIRNGGEFDVLTAANWPAEPFAFGRYKVYKMDRRAYGMGCYYRISGGGYYRGESSEDPANIADQLRAMVAADTQKAADRRAAGPRLAIYHTTDYTRYFIAVEGKTEIVLRYCVTASEAREAVTNDRAALIKRYDDLRNFPALRRAWNRPRTGQEWHAADVTPEQFAAALPFKGVEFGNWLNQQERAALLNSAFDGFHDLAYLLGIPAEAVALGGTLNFSFATRGYKDSAAHFNPCYNTINLNKRNGAGCMAHEWLHACDHYAAALAGVGMFATESGALTANAATLAAREIVAVIKNMDFYTRSKEYQLFTGKQQNGGDYYTEPAELAARGFEGVMLYLLKSAGMCSDFLVNLQGWEAFTEEDADHRANCYPYPSAAEAAALLPYYVKFFRALFGACEVSEAAAAGVASGTATAAKEKAAADTARAEFARKEEEERNARRAALAAERERRAAEIRAQKEQKEREQAAKAETTRAAIVDRLSAGGFEDIKTAPAEDTVYYICRKSGNIYTGHATITADAESAKESARHATAVRVSYKYAHNAKRIILHTWKGAQISANDKTAAALVARLTADDVRGICRRFATLESADTLTEAEQIKTEPQSTPEGTADAKNTKNAHNTTLEHSGEITDPRAAGLALEEIAGGVAVVGDSRATYRNRKSIKAKGCQWNKTAQRWEATTAEAVAAVRAWFGTEDTQTEQSAPTSEATANATTAPAEGATVAQEQTAPEAPALPEWLHVGAVVRTPSRYMMSNRGRRPEWVEGEEMTITAVSAEWVELRSESASESMRTESAARELTPIYSACEISQPADNIESEPAERIAASYEGGAPLTEPAREGLPDWLHVGTRFCLVDFITGEPTKVRYTCAAIDYENKTVTIPEASDTFRSGSHVFRWGSFHWPAFAPINDDTDPTPTTSGKDEGTALQDSGEITDYERQTIALARAEKKRSLSGYNYGPIDYLKKHILYKGGVWSEENGKRYEELLHHVTDGETYAVYLISRYDVVIDSAQIICDMRRAFPDVPFKTVCKYISDHTDAGQQRTAIPAALVPDLDLLTSEDAETRNGFRKRHERFYKLSRFWLEGDEVNTNREKDLKQNYTKEELTVHFLLSHELFYFWRDNRHQEDCLNDIREIYPDTTKDYLRDIRNEYAPHVSEIYG